jgi:hypothetical protein
MGTLAGCLSDTLTVYDYNLWGACGICYELFTNLTSTTLAAKTDA